MNLLIDSSNFDQVQLMLTDKNKSINYNFPVQNNLSEKLIPEIKKFLKKQKVKFENLTGVQVKTDSHFSRTRTVVATANALAWGLHIDQKIIVAHYSKRPNITKLKKG